MDLSWLPERGTTPPGLSPEALRGITFGALMRELGWNVAELVDKLNDGRDRQGLAGARLERWTRSKVNRRIARAKKEITRHRVCACGCNTPIARSARHDCRYVDNHRQRAYARRRRRFRQNRAQR